MESVTSVGCHASPDDGKFDDTCFALDTDGQTDDRRTEVFNNTFSINRLYHVIGV